MMVVAHNLLAMNADRQFNIAGKKKDKNVEKLSSGYKINRAADDAAGLSISEKMRNQIRGLYQASSNIEDGINLVQTADGAMSEIEAIIDRCVTLSTKAANDVLAKEDRDSIQEEIDALLEEIDMIKDTTKFNNRLLLQGTSATTPTVSPVTITGGLPPWASIDSASAASGTMANSFVDENSGIHAAGYLDFSGFSGSDADIEAAVDTGFHTTCCTCQQHYSINFTADTNSSVNMEGDHFIYNVGIGGCQTPDDIYDRITSITGRTPGNHYTNIETVRSTPPTTITQTTQIDEGTAYDGRLRMGVSLTGTSAGDEVTVGIYFNNISAASLTGAVYTEDEQSWILERDGSNRMHHSNYSYLFADHSRGMSILLSSPSYESFNNEELIFRQTFRLKEDITEPLTLVLNSEIDEEEDYLEDEKIHATIHPDGSVTYKGVGKTTTVIPGQSTTPKLAIYDNRTGVRPNAAGGYGLLAPGVAHSETQDTPEEGDIYLQTGANSGEDMLIKLPKISRSLMGLSSVSVANHSSASNALDAFHKSKIYVNSQRSLMGAYQNRLEYSLSNVNNYAENLTSSESNIRDTDMVKESMDLAKHNILEQAGQSMLTQANQQNQGMLQLIQS